MEIGSRCRTPEGFPNEYTQNKHHWLCDVTAEKSGGVVEEYSIEINRKLSLKDFIDILSEEIQNLLVEEAMSWGVKIYRLTQSKR